MGVKGHVKSRTRRQLVSAGLSKLRLNGRNQAPFGIANFVGEAISSNKASSPAELLAPETCSEVDKTIEVALNNPNFQEPNKLLAEFAKRVNEWRGKLELNQVDAKYARVCAMWQGVSDEICQRLPENKNWSRMSVLLTDMQSVKGELERNQVRKSDPVEDRVEAPEKIFWETDTAFPPIRRKKTQAKPPGVKLNIET